jgi:hypothetical protein
VTVATKEGLLHRLENMGFNFYVNYCFMNMVFMEFGKHVLFGQHVSFWTGGLILDI